MPISSMTGFARVEGGIESVTWTWELRSVNGKNLDVRCRLPIGSESMDQMVRTAVNKRLARGNITATLIMDRTRSADAVEINQPYLDRLLDLAADLQARHGATPPRADALLAMNGVLRSVSNDEDDAARSERVTAMTADLDVAIEALAAMRVEEGGRIAAVITKCVDEIARLASVARGHEDTTPARLRERLRGQVAELFDDPTLISEDRLAQEVAMLLVRGDVREELDRLEAHVAAVRDLINGSGPSGRRLDFLCQEFNREANTLCAKSSGLDLSRIGLDLKASIDRLREQVQNIE